MDNDMGEERKTMAYSAAAIYIGAIVVVGIETALPGGPETSIVPGLIAVFLAPVAIVAGPRMPRRALAVFALAGVMLIAVALATTRGGPTDGAVLYMWPVLWMSYFYGRGGAALIVAWVAIAQGVALTTMPESLVSIDRWIDVVASVTVVAAVVHYLSSRNARLVHDLQEQARVDPLTGLLNRRGFDERLSIEITRSLRRDVQMAAARVDVDNFKAVNDKYGHEVGDRVLAWVGSVLAGEARGADVVARTGGDEFTILLPDAGENGGQLMADRIRARIADGSERTREGVPEALRPTVSLGVAKASARDSDALLEAADEALYVAKDAGRDRVVAADLTSVPAT